MAGDQMLMPSVWPGVWLEGVREGVCEEELIGVPAQASH